MPRLLPVPLVNASNPRLQCGRFASKAKSKKPAKGKQTSQGRVEDEEQEEEEFFDLGEHLSRIREVEANALSALEELKPVAMTLEDIEEIPIKDKALSDMAQVVMKSPIVAHLHVFDVRVKSRVVRELVLLRDDWTVQSDEGDLVVVRLPSPNSPQVLQQVAARAGAVQERHHQQLQHALAKAAAKIKQVNIGNNWHRKQHDQLNAAVKGAHERVKAAVKKLTNQA